ncbi:MAG: diguanylate cyclase [Planctomycetes bacterium]|nr:diguanylate cyclase [Planctomycetota bacterium]
MSEARSRPLALLVGETEGLRAALEAEGLDVATVADGVEGLARAQALEPQVLVVTGKPTELSGHALCRLLKSDASTAAIPVVLAGGGDASGDRFWGRRSNADRVLPAATPLGEVAAAARRAARPARAVGEPAAAPHPVTRAGLLDRLVLENTLADETRKLADLVYSRDHCLEQCAVLAESVASCTAIAVAVLDGPRGDVHLRPVGELREGHLDQVKEALVRNAGRADLRDGLRLSFSRRDRIQPGSGEPPFQTSVVHAFRIQNDYVGALCAFHFEKDAFGPTESAFLSDLARGFTPTAKLLQLYEENRLLGIVDPLTRMHNYRFFLETLEREFARAKRYGSHLSLVLLDIDHFRSINENYGHLEGDSLLQGIARVLKDNFREIDLASRYGGNQFALILPETHQEGARLVAERIRKVIADTKFMTARGPLHVTSSAGVASCFEDVKSPTEILKLADDALLEAKKGGRNSTRVHRRE